MPEALFTDLPVTHRPRRSRPARSGIPAGQSLAQPWPLDGAINVVLFAGMGGACQGLERAGFPVHVAVNHDQIAIAAHKALNPRTKHLQADIYEVCPLDATGGRPVNILWASPDCRDHSVAKGGAPRSPRVRSMPWQVCRWVGVLRRAGLGPATVMLENVREIRGWGPLVAKRCTKTGRVLRLDGTVAAKGERVPREQQVLVRDPRHIGRHWRAWVEHMRRLGVDWQDRDMVCADYGVPTTRKRLFGVGQLDGLPIIWPEQTHAHRHSVAVKDGRLLAHASAASIIDWSLPLPSIFSRKKDLQPATQKRIAVGMKRFVLEAAEPFIVHTTHQGARPGHAIGDALSTITGAHRGEMAMVGPSLVPTTHTTSGDRIHDGQQPAPTLTAGVKGGELAVMAGTIIQAAHGDGPPGRAQRWGGGATDLRQPIGTTTASGASHAVVAAYLTEHRGHSDAQDMAAGIGAQTAKDHHAVTAAWMVQHNTGLVGHPAQDGTSTLTTLATQQNVAGAFLIHQRGTGTATSPADAVRTLTAGGDKGGDHVGVGAAFLTEYYGTGGQHQEMADGLNTLPTVDRFSPTMADLASPPLSPQQLARAREVAEFLRAHGVWSGGELVTLTFDGSCWIVADIGMRMLRPHEAAAAHQLRMPETITLAKLDRDGRPVIGPDGQPVMITRPLTKTEAMRLVGNSVPQWMAFVLSRANGRHPLEMPGRAAVAAE